jgi:hypothetical protein
MAGIKRTEADKWFSNYIRARDNFTCQRCGKKFPKYVEGGDNTALMGLDTAHCFTRGHSMVRFDPNNAISLCYGCHSYADQNPEDVLYPLFKSKIGEEAFEELMRKKNIPYRGVKKDQKMISKHFRELFREMLKQQEETTL